MYLCGDSVVDEVYPCENEPTCSLFFIIIKVALNQKWKFGSFRTRPDPVDIWQTFLEFHRRKEFYPMAANCRQFVSVSITWLQSNSCDIQHVHLSLLVARSPVHLNLARVASPARVSAKSSNNRDITVNMTHGQEAEVNILV